MKPKGNIGQGKYPENPHDDSYTADDQSIGDGFTDRITVQTVNDHGQFKTDQNKNKTIKYKRDGRPHTIRLHTRSSGCQYFMGTIGKKQSTGYYSHHTRKMKLLRCQIHEVWRHQG